MATRKRTSRILAEVHEAARDLHDAGAIDALTMRRFDALCLPPVPQYTGADVRRIRKEANVSQAVFAAVLNVGRATVAAWEQGGKEPSGPALKLLDLVERKGLSALA
jgi:putative transcriptional regulator